ncbi:Peptidase M48, Ste24p [Hyphomicrobium sp. GJ21]|nr:Peptidase M48, Ste24p [Hyphomicrobium sp. GJ21]
MVTTVRRFGFCTMAAALGFCSGAAQAQTLFDVEHARGNYRAGLVSEYDADLVRTWGAPSGNYPGARYLDARQRDTRAVRTQRARAKRTTRNSTGN